MDEIPLDLIIRFSSSQRDLSLAIEQPSSVTVLSLKQRIRAELPPPANANRLRLIHAGRVLSDNVALSKCLNYSAPPPSTRNNGDKSERSKGKQPLGRAKPVARVYVHCSVGDALIPSELVTEAKDAQEADDALKKVEVQTSRGDSVGDGSGSAPTTTTPAPQGFDRLLNAGFTQAEVATLRAQFLAIQAHTHTPDTMPTGTALFELEERWLDSSNSPANGVDGTSDAGGFGSEDAAGLEDMLWGNLIGFFWPIGALCWAMREEGVWTHRRQIAVLSGFLVNLTFGFLRIMN
ncbi:hypothetical protein K431DRAFT_230729 [Polychaeton citri CBS 116435]|uniref:Ubiquitin-like domain-containing protein n=1 Tax=Polychaeton citri CBS 116435 TaxID=1314669 RepID=A0A9P4Q0R2_9PEZI|nr:hypothetical protein K431DRAFT_230729 [Polychaeton citri CBS 116435]